MSSAPAASPIVRIVVDSSAVVPAVNAANNHLGRLGQTGNGIQDIFDRLANAFGGAGSAAGGAATQTSALQRIISGLGASASAAANHIGGLGGAFTSIGLAGAALGITAVVGGMAALGMAAVKTSAQFQSYRASLTTVLGDTDKAGQAFDRLTEFAAKTPFSLDQSVEGFIKLKALGLQPSEAAMISYGNTASAMGKDLNQMVEAVADAATGEFERLKEFGIKSVNEGDKVSFTFQNVKTTVANNSQEIQKYLMAIGNTQFAGAMDRQMETFAGAAANLSDTWSQTLAKIGDGGLSTSIARVMNMITSGIESATPILVGLGNVMAGVVNGVASIGSGLSSLFSGMVTNGGVGLTFVETLTLALNVVGQGAQVAGNLIGGAFSLAGGVIGGVVGTVRTLFAGLWDWLGLSSSKSTGDMGVSFVGVLRSAKYMTEQLPKLFSIALGTIGGMFSTIGKRVADFFGGNWSAFDGMGDALAAQFNKGTAALGKISDKATAIAKDSKGAADAWDRMLGREKKKGGATLDELAGPVPTATADPKKDDGKAKAAADALKKQTEFWKARENELATAKLLTLEAEVFGKELEFQRSLGRAMLGDEKTRLASIMQATRTESALTALKQAQRDAQNEYTVESQRALGLTSEQRAVEDQLFQRRNDALSRGVDISSAAYQAAETDLKTQLAKLQALKEQNALLAKAGDFARRFSAAFDMSDQLRQMGKERDAFVKAWTDGGGIIEGQQVTTEVFDSILAGYDQARVALKNRPLMDALDNLSRAGSLTAQAQLDRYDTQSDYDRAKASITGSGLSAADQDRAMKEVTRDYTQRMREANRLVANDFADTMADGVRAIARMFGGTMGKLLDNFGQAIDNMSANADGTSPIAKVLTRIDGTLGSGFADGARNMTDWGKGLKDLSNPLQSLKDGFSGPNGSFMKGIGQAVGGAMQGYEMGSAIGGGMEAIGLKGSGTGAQIGGTIGGLTGNPLIAAGASILGGLVGSILRKPKYGSAVVTGGTEADVNVTGNKSKYRKAASSAAGSVQEGLASIAEAFGGAVGAFDLVIGTYEKKWRVRDTSTGMDSSRLNFKGSSANGLHDFGDDSAAAIAYAIQNAIEDGAITGISDLASKALKQLGADGALSLVEGFKTIENGIDEILDPIGYSLRSLNSPLDDLKRQMEAVGASSTDLAKIEQYRQLKMDELRKQQLSTVDDILASIRGEAAGRTALDILNENLATFDSYQDRIAAGDNTIDQSAYAALVEKIMAGSNEVWGTATSQNRSILKEIEETTLALRKNIETGFNSAAGADAVTAANDATNAAITAQTTAIVNQQTNTNVALAENNQLQRAILAAQEAQAAALQTLVKNTTILSDGRGTTSNGQR
ncbi:hypothetical protein SAMN05518849_11687 [Sphingobium sp. AP50]|uniref:tape measure protein n=1 Tax=Sphingobium sp. AP50 TaxID=1884369 RepID=UPI0008BD72AE|nr:tape measure protein [Sphingobium sp. AP50]SEJ87586.1 hypothetical protein SAMN05518849_11687 [Sphingobium sp. AP50]